MQTKARYSPLLVVNTSFGCIIYPQLSPKLISREHIIRFFKSMSSRSGRNGANSSSTPAFMKLLRRIANSSLMKDAANNSANKLHELYNEAQEIIDSQDVGIGDEHRFPPMSVTVNVGSFCNVTNALNIHCRTVGIPFFDDDWVFKYWIPMSRLCIP